MQVHLQGSQVTGAICPPCSPGAQEPSLHWNNCEGPATNPLQVHHIPRKGHECPDCEVGHCPSLSIGEHPAACPRRSRCPAWPLGSSSFRPFSEVSLIQNGYEFLRLCASVSRLRLPIAIAYCYCPLILPIAIAYCHCHCPLPLPIADCHCLLPLPDQRLIFEYH